MAGLSASRIADRLRSRLVALLFPASSIHDGLDSYGISFFTVRIANDVYLVPKFAAHRPACAAVLQGKLYEPLTHELVAVLLGEFGGDMVHAGTFFGDMLPSFARACSKTVYAFEPVLENFVLAKLCLERNSIENVFLINAGLGDKISIGHVDTGDASGKHKGGASEISIAGQLTSVTTIDSFEFSDVSLIQLDVEGHELHALRGAKATIDRCSPVILVEDNHDDCGEFLRARGYGYIGQVPGLKLWSTDRDADKVRTVLNRLPAGNDWR